MCPDALGHIPISRFTESRSGLANHHSVQEVHGQTTEAQILVSADWVTDVSVRSVALFVSETVNRHRKELHAILEIVVDVLSCSSLYVDFPLSKRFRSSLVAGQRAEPISNDLEVTDFLCAMGVVINRRR